MPLQQKDLNPDADMMDWWDVARQIRPGILWDEFVEDWNAFQAWREKRRRRIN